MSHLLIIRGSNSGINAAFRAREMDYSMDIGAKRGVGPNAINLRGKPCIIQGQTGRRTKPGD